MRKMSDVIIGIVMILLGCLAIVGTLIGIYRDETLLEFWVVMGGFLSVLWISLGIGCITYKTKKR